MEKKMNERLKRELNKTYLILSSEGSEYEESYELEMLSKNELQTILPLRVLRVDSSIDLYYEVSAKQSLKECINRVKLSGETIQKLFRTIDDMIIEVKDYLLDEESILLDLEHIYTKEGHFYFCYCPWEKHEILGSFRRLLEEILGELDYHDTEGVELAYHLYQNACKGILNISEILNEHKKEEKQEVPKKDYEEYLMEEVLEDFHEEEKKESEKTGVFRRILEFFLKKQEPEMVLEEESPIWEHGELKTFGEKREQINYTELLETPNSNTILLENMPMGRWKLRPLVSGYEEFCISGDSFLVGKKRDSVDGFIGRDTISRIHSRLFVKNDRLFIADANSTNGTYVNGVCIAPGIDVEIFPGDRILFADVGYECYNSL